ncbi:hypothetical protein C2869_12100 [Saccharobesus litoralis]|uniref:Lipoprotein n=1 Tax=Saccharobesus litoralis TaxID=2172099 RepID=A0A2S0VSE6_9ALTE|nr:hypothetical protein [Saccharobesus litoralis]AWB67129.1 hypothetical protein C2869_12100 [Saccharobesus litoralis]
MKILQSTLIAILTSLLSACVIYPEKVHYYDEDCGVTSKKYELKKDIEKIEQLGECVGQACAIKLLAVAGITSAELVVSGTVVMAGNTVYWLEKQANCKNKAPDSQE